MPLTWLIDSQKQTVDLKAEGRLTVYDWLESFEVIEGARALTYRKLLDTRQAVMDMTPEDLMQVIVAARGYHTRGRVGALSVVGAERQVEQWAALLGAFAAADRPMKVFSGERRARSWLRSLSSASTSRALQ